MKAFVLAVGVTGWPFVGAWLLFLTPDHHWSLFPLIMLVIYFEVALSVALIAVLVDAAYERRYPVAARRDGVRLP